MKQNWTTNLNICTCLYIITCRVKESLGPLRGGISGSLRFGDPVGVAVAERDRPGPIAPIAVPGVLWWWCSPDEPICAEEITPALRLGMKQKYCISRNNDECLLFYLDLAFLSSQTIHNLTANNFL